MSYRITGVLLFLAAFVTDARADGERIALCIGINKYDDSGFEKLEYAENDATEFATTLRDVGYKVVLMTTATGKNDPTLAPTTKNFDAQFKALIEKRTPDDLVVLAFVGHSVQFDKDPNCFFCFVDAKASRDKTTTRVSMEDVYTQLGRCSAGAKVLLADCRRIDPDPTHSHSPNTVLEKIPPKGLFALFACSPNEQTYENKKLEHGVFFYHLLKGLKTVNNANKDLEFQDLAKVVIQEVPKTVIQLVGEEKKQNPNLKSPKSSASVMLLTRNDREVLADYQAKAGWLRENETIVGFIKENGPRRVAIWKTAAERGSPKGMMLYAHCLVVGAGVAKDATEAVKWYRKAAELGDADAMYDLSLCIHFGIGVRKDVVESMKWMRNAIELGDQKAMHCLGAFYLNGEGVVKDAVEAVKWFRKAAELGNPLAMYQLGGCYYLGDGIGRNEEEAVKWFRKAAELGNKDGMRAVGSSYLRGEGVAKDAVEAVKWFRKAAELGNTEAIYNLGVRYLKGEGVAQDVGEAVKWFRKAAERGSDNAKAVLKQLGEQ